LTAPDLIAESKDGCRLSIIREPHANLCKNYSREIMTTNNNEAGKTEGSTPLHHRQPATSTVTTSRYNTVVFESASERTIEAHAVHMIAIKLPMKAKPKPKPKPKTDLFGLCRYERSEIRAWLTWLDVEYGWELDRPPEAIYQAASASGKGEMNQIIGRSRIESRDARTEVAARPEQATTTIEGFLSSRPSVSLGCTGNLKSCPREKSQQQAPQEQEGRIIDLVSTRTESSVMA
jgi:hypothetical protein